MDDGRSPEKAASDKADEFAAALTALSIKHGIAITGSPVLFVMEREDYDSQYKVDAESRLSFG